MSKLQTSETGKIKSKNGHSEPSHEDQKSLSNMGGGSGEMQSPHRPFPPAGHNPPANIPAKGSPVDAKASEVAMEQAAMRVARAKAMDMAHMRGKADITKAANEE